MSERRHDADFLLRLLDSSPGIVFVIDEQLTITWANEAAVRLLGYDLDDALGRSVLDFLDPTWNPRAFESIGTALAGHGLRAPMLFRVLAADGSRPIIEAQANVRFDDPLVRGVVTYARLWTAQWLLDRTLDSVAAGEPISDTLDLLVQVVGAEPMDAPASFLFDRVDGRVMGVAAAPELPLAMRGPVLGVSDDVVAVWSDLLRAPTEQVHDVETLAEPLRSIAREQHAASLWVWPTDVDDDGVPSVWVVAWRDEPKLDEDQTRVDLMSRLATISALALSRWRTEVSNAYAAAHDAMTGLWNRASVLEYLDDALAGELPEARDGVGVAYLDLDGFKSVNDRFGHSAGDRVLTTVAERMAAAAPSIGRLGRFGGDEFVYVGPAATDDELVRVADSLAATIDAPIGLRSGERVDVGTSVGTARCRPGEMTLDELIERADRMLYRNKARRGT